jgi:hypothetical protein
MLALRVVIRVTLMLVSWTLPISWSNAGAAIVALIVGLSVLFSRRRAIEQTTLVSASWWALGTVVGWSAAELAAGLSLVSSSTSALVRYCAVTLSFCPVIALLGAKRPQHGAWNFIVVSLWAIVALPAAENLLLRRGISITVGEARGWFLWILILLGPINFAPTRFWLPSLLIAAGQAAALAGVLPVLRNVAGGSHDVFGLVLVTAAIAAAELLSRSERRCANAFDRLWLNFRDSFGLLWALRVQERVNSLARQEGWDLELGWSGFMRRSSGERLTAIDSAIEPALRTSLKGLLRRFVSGEWIEERLSRGK